MRKIIGAEVLEYPKIDLFDRDMNLWKHVLWAYLYDEETGYEIRHYQNEQLSGLEEVNKSLKQNRPSGGY